MKWNIALILIVSFFLIQTGYARNQDKKIKITGVVMDANKRPVSNAIIFVDKVKTNSVTDSKGAYSVKVRPTAKKIVAYSVTNGAQEADINGQTVVNIIFAGESRIPAAPAPKEKETVNVGYGETNKEDLTMPVNTLKGNKSRYQSYNNVYEMLTGEVPGVEVSGTSIKIRNATSFQLGTEPLFVVDGIIVPTINDIVPAQVKSIEVLKGSAASIYGARGANGVIVITLLSGRDIK
jgi:TonB-dependent SusC/RagA subfamily outer membrane receptor